jgi:hypothetical protein
VNTLSPGVVDTPMLDSQATTPEEAAAIREGYAEKPENRNFFLRRRKFLLINVRRSATRILL